MSRVYDKAAGLVKCNLLAELALLYERIYDL